MKDMVSSPAEHEQAEVAGAPLPGAEANELVAALAGQTERALWEVENVIACLPDSRWQQYYGGAPLWQHVYHMLHSLDQWFINPRDATYRQPACHRPGLNDLDTPPAQLGPPLSRAQLDAYRQAVAQKIRQYLAGQTDEGLRRCPPGCAHSAFTLALAQYRHLHTHLGMLMGFVIAESGQWPRVLGLEGDFPDGEDFDRFF